MIVNHTNRGWKYGFNRAKEGVINLPKSLRKKIGDYVPIHLNLGVKTLEILKAYASRNEMSVSDVVRIAVNDWCSRKGFYAK